jgi:O-antigen/teichoic acid export membrane protein
VSSGGVSIIEHALVMVLSMVTFAILLHRFGLETVGLWSLLTALLNYGHIGDVWSKGLLSFVGEERGRGATTDAAAYASTTIIAGAAGYLLLMTIGAFAIYVFAPRLVSVEQVSAAQDSLPLMVLAYWLIACSGNFLLAFVGFGYAWMRTLQRTVGALLLLAGVLVLDPAHGLAGILWVQIVQGVVMVVFGVVGFYGFIARGIPHRLWDRKKFGNLFRFGSKMFIVGGVQYSIEPLIKVLVSQFAGLAVLAVLEVVIRLIQGLRGLVLSVGQVIVTSFARRQSVDAKSGHGLLREDFLLVAQLILGSSLVTFSLLFAAGPLISLVFLDAEARAGVGIVFPVLYIAFGLAWFVNTSVSSGNFLLMSLRASRRLFTTVVIRAALIAALGYPLGVAFGLGGVMAVVLLAFVLSALHLFATACQAISLPLSQGIREMVRMGPLGFIPLAWSLGLTVAWALTAGSMEGRMLQAFAAVALLSTAFLVARYSRLRVLARSVMELRP